LFTVEFMLPDPFGECFFPTKSVRMLGKTRDCPLGFHAWVVYSFLWWKRRYQEGVTAKEIAKFTGLQRSSTVKRALHELQELRLATSQGGRWKALSQPVEPTDEVKHHKMGEWVQIVPGPQPLKPWFASKKKPPKYKHAPTWGLYLPTSEAPLTLIQCGLVFLLNSYRTAIYPTIRVKKRSHAQLSRMLGVHQETIPKALLALERHGLIATGPECYELIRPDAEKLAWFRDATRPSYLKAQERQQQASVDSDPKLEVMQQMMSGGIPAPMCVELVEFCDKNRISLDTLRRYYQELRVLHKQNQLDGKYTEIRHCGFLLKKRLEKVAKAK
jgi:hypothetical protein